MGTQEERIESLEHSYGTINRTFNVDIVPIIRKLDHAIMGHWDEEKNEFINGLVQQVAIIADTSRSTKKRVWMVLGVAKEIFVGLAVVYLLCSFGLKGG